MEINVNIEPEEIPVVTITVDENSAQAAKDAAEEAKAALAVIKAGSMLVFKLPPNENLKEQEPGDFCMGFVEGQFINADYLGGDKNLLASYNI